MSIKAGKDLGAHIVDHEILGVATRAWVNTQISGIGAGWDVDGGDSATDKDSYLGFDGGDVSDYSEADDMQLALQYDDTEVGGIAYVGEAVAGSATSAAAWRIKEVTTTGPDVAVLWADGDTSFDNIWDNRAALSYS